MVDCATEIRSRGTLDGSRIRECFTKSAAVIFVILWEVSVKRSNWLEVQKIAKGLFLCLAVGMAAGQSVRGGLAGNVLDKSGASVPGASVSAKNEATGDISKGVSTSSGSYRFAELPLGKYDITVSMPGFTTRVYTGVLVQVQQITSLNMTLEAGATETITVNADNPTVEAETSDVGGVITSKQITDLPLSITAGVGQFRAPEAFMFLIPGTAGPGTANNSGGIYLNKVAGGQNYGNEVLLDGASVQRSENGSSFDQESPSVEALDQFKLTTSLPQAEYGRTTGGIENFVTKSGTNKLHGTVFDILRNNRLDSNGWFSNGNESLDCSGTNNTAACRSTFARPSDTKNDYGVSLGGPVRIPHLYNGSNKLFFFFAWEKVHYTLGSLTTTTVPTDAEKGGDFSNIAIYNPSSAPVGTNPCDGMPVYNGEIFDPSTTRAVKLSNGSSTECREPFPDNKINTPLSPAAVKLLSYFPEAQNQNLVANNYSYKGADVYNNTTYSIRIDADLSERNKVFVSYSTRENTIPSGAAPILPDPIDPNHWIQDFITHFSRVGWDFAFTPSLLNHLTLGYNRSNSINVAPAILDGKNWTASLGISGANSLNFPVVANGFTDTEGIAQFADNIDNGVRLADSIRWQKGRNSFAFGADIRWQQYSPIDQNNPTLGFSPTQTAGAPSLTGTGNGLASELLGEASGGSQTDYLHQSRWQSWYDGFYAQDDLKVTKDLILNLGIRYDLDLPRHEAKNDTSNFSPTALDPEYGVPGALIFGTTCHCNTSWANAYHKEISPRIGFAFSPTSLQGKTVFRGGAAILYGPLQYSDFGGDMVTGYQTSQALPNNGFDPSFQIDSGYPSFAPPPNLDPGFFNGRPVAGSYIKPEYGRPASIYQWNLQLQQEVAKDLILTVGFIGNEAQNLHSNLENNNNIPIADLALGPQLSEELASNNLGAAPPFANYYSLWGNAVTVQQALRPFPQYDYIDSGCCLQNVGHSTYDALISSLQRRFRGGLTLLASYTWSKTLTDSDSLLPNNGVGVAQDQNVNDLHESKSISAQDIPQTFVISYLYQLPFGNGRRYLTGRFENYFVGGWEIGGIQRYQSGQPESFCCQAGIPGYEQAIRFRRIPTSSIKSAAYRKGSKAINPFNTQFGSDPTVNSLYNGSTVNYTSNPNGAALRAVAVFDPTVRDANTIYSNSGGKTIAPYVLGNTPRVTGEVRTPNYYDEDFSVLKHIPIRAGVDFVFKFELFNAFNRHTFNLPDLGPSDFLFGVPTSTIQGNPQRAGQVTARITF
jgi:hypothetical protein